jgi:hypothetical protein
LKNYNSYWNLFAYHNNIVIKFQFADCYYNDETYKRSSYTEIITINNDYYTIYNYAKSNIQFFKIYNYYNEQLDYLTIIYQAGYTLEYMTFNNNKEIYKIKSLTSILRVKTNEEIDFDVSNLIESDTNFGNLYIQKYKIISTSNPNDIITKTYPLDSLTFPIDKENHKMMLEPSENFWYEFTFALEERNDNYLRIFNLPSTKLTIRTCAFQCGSCTTDYYTCDSCRDSNYSKKNGSTDKNCYPINQIIENYIYDSSTGYFEQCYSTCQFCSIKGSSSSQSQQNCLSCKDIYFLSYENLGNCYLKNDDIEDKDIYIQTLIDTSFTSIDSCSSLTDKNYKISSTKECVTTCPSSNFYYSYECIDIDFTEQEYGKILDQQCSSTQINSPKYYL